MQPSAAVRVVRSSDSLFPISYSYVFRIDALVSTDLAPLPVELRDVPRQESVFSEKLLVVADREHRPVTATTRELLHRRDERAPNAHALCIGRDRQRAQLGQARRILIQMLSLIH